MYGYDDVELQEAPRITAWNTVVSYASYSEARATVDRLTESGFPVEELEIVGSGLRSVERVTGPMTWNRAVVSAAATGAWIGLFIGFLVGMFTAGPSWLGLVLGGLLIGAVWGTAFGLAARWLNRGQHLFSSVHSVVATRYDVIADGAAERARSALGLAETRSANTADSPRPSPVRS